MPTKTLTLSAMIAAVLYISAQLAFLLPMISPVPITLQVFAICLFPLILPLSISVTGMIVYLTLGAIGLPVFAQAKGGMATFFGPTGGYLIGFLLATIVIAYAVKIFSRPTIWRNLALCIVGLLISYGCGVVGLMLVLNVSFAKALIIGVVPFIAGDLIKIVLASSVALAVAKRLDVSTLTQQQ
ncbi:biotin transporter BioY [Heliophilum fasciatum]|uniref:Biotin transporter n=1 Tax=Heliophilum fasciatum TaxID=35700 RepID=A0A4R2RL62_9FIRM|nr:biotin transporter BioY [Heliophilum fasciatum]MCW2279300.1 biotin transport system substrate-specific component [Heliophilum fasciatum]TCP60461.1 biotin transport system substrate-specific component [Heliophilum fasciatum]